MAVYTDVSPEALASFLSLYDVGRPTSFCGIAEGVENSNYLLRTERDGQAADYILTLYERRVDPAELPWFLGLMHHLARAGLRCPEPVAGADGALFHTLNGRQAALTTFLTGLSTREVDAAQCEAVGAAMARLHLMGASYAPVRANTLGPAAWAPLLQAGSNGADKLEPRLVEEVSAAIADVTAQWPSTDSLPRGQIHADLFPDNVFFVGKTLSGIIDFYFACTDFFAYDLAIAINAWCFPDEATLDPRLSAAMLDGYCSVRPLEGAERDALRPLCQGAAIRFLLTRLYDWVHTPEDALVTRKDPLPYLARLRCHRAFSEPCPYG